MTNDAENQVLLDRIDALTQLLEEANIAEQYKEIQRKMAETELANQSRLQKEKLDIEELEKALEKSSMSIEAVEKIHDEKIEQLTKYKKDIALSDIEYDRARASNKSLEADILELEKELEEECRSENALPENPDSLPLVIYEGMGINMTLDGDGKVRMAVLRSDQHDLLSLPLEENHLSYITTRIWDFISK